jgi:hypothetical protein
LERRAAALFPCLHGEIQSSVRRVTFREQEQAVTNAPLDRNSLRGHCHQMALIDHIRRCNRWTPSDFLPLMAGDKLLGMLRPETALLSDFPELFVEHDEKVGLSDHYTTAADRTAAFRPIAERLALEGLIEKLRDEDYRVARRRRAAGHQGVRHPCQRHGAQAPRAGVAAVDRQARRRQIGRARQVR